MVISITLLSSDMYAHKHAHEWQQTVKFGNYNRKLQPQQRKLIHQDNRAALFIHIKKSYIHSLWQWSIISTNRMLKHCVTSSLLFLSMMPDCALCDCSTVLHVTGRALHVCPDLWYCLHLHARQVVSKWLDLFSDWGGSTCLIQQLLGEKLLIGGCCYCLKTHLSLKVDNVLYRAKFHASDTAGILWRTVHISMERLNLKLVSTAHFLFLYDKQEKGIQLCRWKHD